MSNTQKPEAMYLKDALAYLGISRTTFYTHYMESVTKKKDANGYRHIFLKSELDAIKEKITAGTEIVKA